MPLYDNEKKTGSLVIVLFMDTINIDADYAAR
jgi:hypothetical protein